MKKILISHKIHIQMGAKMFDPEGVGVHNGRWFGMPFSVSEAALALISVPWDVTSSYGGGSSRGPAAMLEASTQLDFYDPWAPEAWRRGIATVPIDDAILQHNNELRPLARKIIEAQEEGKTIDPRALQKINRASGELNIRVEYEARKLLGAGKLVGVVGGDHSTPFGLISALGQKHESFGILHLDAHCDLRERYEGFEGSHASVMFNVLRDVPRVSHLVQVGVRDFSTAEMEFARTHKKVTLFTGALLAQNSFVGVTWAEQCRQIVSALPSRVYISFDVDFCCLCKVARSGNTGRGRDEAFASPPARIRACEIIAHGSCLG